MTEVSLHALGAMKLPEPWEELSNGGRLFAVDAFRMEGRVEVVLPLDQRQNALISEVFPGATLTFVPGGIRATLPDEDIKLDWRGRSVGLPVSDDAAEPNAGRNTLLTVVTEPEVATLIDWMRYHADLHRAETAVVFLRTRPDHDVGALVEAISQADTGLAHIQIVTCPEPLGQVDQGPESLRHYAPDAPGKALLEAAQPDPWLSSLREVSVLEVARLRFTRLARAVLFCQPSDLIKPIPGGSVFDAVQEGTGFVRFSGRRAYPFAIPEDDTARHGDHNCRAFDGVRSENIWCVAPTRLADGVFWRQFRVSSAIADPASSGLFYWRCMALRHPGLKVAEMVPKTSLVLDTELDDLVRKSFKTDPKGPPVAEPTKVRRNDRILVVTTMKNEGPFILEWLAYHRAIGVTDFLVYTNDCTDGTDRMFDLLQAKGLLTHKENPYRETGEKPQHAAYRAAEDTDLARSADWIICMDVDEFINIHVGKGSLSDLFAAVPDATMISLTWRLFGNADIDRFKDAPIIEQFHRCAPKLCRKPHQAWGFKTLFRNLGHYKKFGVHRPKGLKPEYLDQISYVNGSGRPMPDRMLRGGWRSSTSTIGYDLVTLNHYALRSAESFLVKRDRGRVNHVDRDQGLNYWFRMNHNPEVDLTIQNKLSLMRVELAKLMEDPEIAEQHEACVTAHRHKIAELLEREDYRAFHADITGERLRALSRMLHGFGSAVFEGGPDMVPQDFHNSHKHN